ncbi:uncharacterized protein LOC126843362 [Adelges cooleyi]|uniref:uncharacterized protein LOC126843362 n=1 Tax=Adelges cooleyi TaxID=133065 RepID=UPI00218008C9|nr:uncharacterized protein LOC126843362 [Adelges cooleyi]
MQKLVIFFIALIILEVSLVTRGLPYPGEGSKDKEAEDQQGASSSHELGEGSKDKDAEGASSSERIAALRREIIELARESYFSSQRNVRDIGRLAKKELDNPPQKSVQDPQGASSSQTCGTCEGTITPDPQDASSSRGKQQLSIKEIVESGDEEFDYTQQAYVRGLDEDSPTAPEEVGVLAKEDLVDNAQKKDAEASKHRFKQVANVLCCCPSFKKGECGKNPDGS